MMILAVAKDVGPTCRNQSARCFCQSLVLVSSSKSLLRLLHSLDCFLTYTVSSIAVDELLRLVSGLMRYISTSTCHCYLLQWYTIIVLESYVLSVRQRSTVTARAIAREVPVYCREVRRRSD